VQSASSINTFKLCPRKYYYAYIENLPTKPSIHTIRGNIVHSVLEDFFDIDINGVTKDNCRPFLQGKIIGLLVRHWQEYKTEFDKITITPTENAQFKEETVVMLLNWLNHFVNRVFAAEGSFEDVFKKFIPVREQYFESAQHMVRGYIDAIERVDGKVHIIDYKTSKSAHLSSEYKLQMAIYFLLYQEKHGGLPDKASFFFLKHRSVEMPVEPDLVELAKKEISIIHAHTECCDQKDEYPMQPNNLCSYCDFNSLCFPKQKKLMNF
jgi:CRISPR/Cas system-associated exonuclease Cas4 (RecB family)